eukprot:Hpha_TRINITY_DN30770_c0_g1::TRINITY_DN30770_c0_g1_i1::g.28341::m.28341
MSLLVYVQTPEGKVLPVETDLMGTVKDLAEAFAAITGWAPPQLLLAGDPLNPEDLLADSGVSSECLLTVVREGNIFEPPNAGWLLHTRVVETEDPLVLEVPRCHGSINYGVWWMQWQRPVNRASAVTMEVLINVNTDGEKRRNHQMDERYRLGFAPRPEENVSREPEEGFLWYCCDGLVW